MKSIDDGDDNVSEADVMGDSGVGSWVAVRSVTVICQGRD